ncbi:MAG: sulfurtransferase complex subunit TusB [Pseudomonadota bacterium]
MTLHTLNKHTNNLVQLCMSALAVSDSLLLFEDGVYAALVNAELQQNFATLPASIGLYVLVEDLEARGIEGKIPDRFIRITYRQFVNLSLTCSKVVNWN